jgi:hypothetical protein
MPRAVESIEGKILKYFRTAPAAAVSLLLGLVKDAVRERQGGTGGIPPARKASTAPRPATTAANHHAKPGPKPGKKAKAKKSHHKRKPTAAAEAPQGELEDFGQI